MKKQFIIGYALAGVLTLWSLLSGNYEFLIYAGVAVFAVGLLHFSDTYFSYSSFALWGFNIWIVLHTFGGLYKIGDGVLYSYVLIPIIDAPYSVLKYDQIVHAYCYFIIALLVWSVVRKYSLPTAPFLPIAFITVLAAAGIGGLNEIVEFLATVLIEDVNVGGYENTAIDIVANTIGAAAAVPFFKHNT